MSAERSTWIRIARNAGVDITRGESLDSIKAKVTEHDRGSFNAAAAGSDGCTCWATGRGGCLARRHAAS
jgi:hypothetical protein